MVRRAREELEVARGDADLVRTRAFHHLGHGPVKAAPDGLPRGERSLVLLASEYLVVCCADPPLACVAQINMPTWCGVIQVVV